jgi:hypothetical protein
MGFTISPANRSLASMRGGTVSAGAGFGGSIRLPAEGLSAAAKAGGHGSMDCTSLLEDLDEHSTTQDLYEEALYYCERGLLACDKAELAKLIAEEKDAAKDIAREMCAKKCPPATESECVRNGMKWG